MAYDIIISPEAEADLDNLRKSDRKKALEAIELHLTHEPMKESKSRIKRLRNFDRPQYRLRIDELRVFYDVFFVVGGGTVEVLAVREKSDAMKWLTEYGIVTDETSTTE
jgi:mRNA interferase RelE/StbE